MTANTRVAHRKLGQSNIEVSALGLGCWQFSKGNGTVGNFWPVMEQDDIQQIIARSLEGGINWFDTAEAYGKGQSEMALAEALNQLGTAEEDAIIATKWWPLFRKASSIGNTIDVRKEALKGRSIDLYQIHQPFSFSSVKDEIAEMIKLLKNGDIRHVGVSNFNAKQMREAHSLLKDEGYFLASNQVKYSLLDRRIESNGILETAKELGISIIAYSPLEQGILSGKFHVEPENIKKMPGLRKFSTYFRPAGIEKSQPLIDLLGRLAEKYEVSSAQVALNWTIQFHGDVMLAIPGASKLRHAEENIGALQFQLSKEDMDEIDEVSRRAAKF